MGERAVAGTKKSARAGSQALWSGLSAPPGTRKYPDQADLAADEARVLGQGLQRGGGALEQQVVERALMRAGERAQLAGHGEGDQEMRHGQEQRALLREPALGGVVLALWTVAVLARMIGVDQLLARLTEVDLSAQALGAAGLDVVQGAPVRGQHARAEARAVLRPVAAEDLRQLHRRSPVSEVLHQRIDGLRGAAVGLIGEVGIDRSGAGRVVAQILLDVARESMPRSSRCVA